MDLSAFASHVSSRLPACAVEFDPCDDPADCVWLQRAMLNVFLGSALLCRPSTRDQSNTTTTTSLRASIDSLNVSFASGNVAGVDTVKLLPIDINTFQRAVVLAVQRGLSDSVSSAHARALSIYLRLQVPTMEAVNKLVEASEAPPLARSMSIAKWLVDQLQPINRALCVIETVLRPARFSCTPSLPVVSTADDTPTCGSLLVEHILAPLHRSSESNQSLLIATACSLFASARSVVPDSPAANPLEQTEEIKSAISLLTAILGELTASEMQPYVATLVTVFLDVICQWYQQRVRTSLLKHGAAKYLIWLSERLVFDVTLLQTLLSSLRQRIFANEPSGDYKNQCASCVLPSTSYRSQLDPKHPHSVLATPTCTCWLQAGTIERWLERRIYYIALAPFQSVFNAWMSVSIPTLLAQSLPSDDVVVVMNIRALKSFHIMSAAAATLPAQTASDSFLAANTPLSSTEQLSADVATLSDSIRSAVLNAIQSYQITAASSQPWSMVAACFLSSVKHVWSVVLSADTTLEQRLPEALSQCFAVAEAAQSMAEWSHRVCSSNSSSDEDFQLCADAVTLLATPALVAFERHWLICIAKFVVTRVAPDIVAAYERSTSSLLSMIRRRLQARYAMSDVATALDDIRQSFVVQSDSGDLMALRRGMWPSAMELNADSQCPSWWPAELVQRTNQIAATYKKKNASRKLMICPQLGCALLTLRLNSNRSACVWASPEQTAVLVLFASLQPVSAVERSFPEPQAGCHLRSWLHHTALLEQSKLVADRFHAVLDSLKVHGILVSNIDASWFALNDHFPVESASAACPLYLHSKFDLGWLEPTDAVDVSETATQESADMGIQPLIDAAIVRVLKARQRCSKESLFRLVRAHWLQLLVTGRPSELQDEWIEVRLAAMMERGFAAPGEDGSIDYVP